MKLNRSTITSILFASLLPYAQADTFTLTDGTKFKGEIISEEGDSYHIRAEVSPGIRDNKTIKKILIEKIEKTDLSIPRYEAIKDTLPAPDLLKADDYQKVLDASINPFLEEFPDSKFAPDIKKMKATIESEMKSIKDGGIKIDGKIITPSERAMNQYEIDALVIYTQMQKFATSRNFSSAMQKFEILEKDYKSTIYFEKAVEFSKKLLPAYKNDLMKMSGEVEKVMMTRKTTLNRLDSGQKTRAEKKFSEEENAYQSALIEAKSAKSKWLPTNRFHKRQIDNNLKLIERQVSKLTSIKPSPVDGGQMYREILDHLDKNELTEAKTKLRPFKSGRPAKSYITTLEDKLKNAQVTMKELESERKREAKEEAMKAKEAEKTKMEKEAEMKKGDKAEEMKATETK